MADTRIHGTTDLRVGKHFTDRKRGMLLPRPPARFRSYWEAHRIVHRAGHIEVERAYCAVPPEYLAQEISVRWNARMVRIFNERM